MQRIRMLSAAVVMTLGPSADAARLPGDASDAAPPAGSVAVSVAPAAKADFIGPPDLRATTLAEAAERALPLGPRTRPPASSETGASDGGAADTGFVARVIPVLLPLGVVVGLIVAAAWAVRRFARLGGGLGMALGAGGRAPSGILEVLGRYPVARGQALVLVKLDRRILLLSHAGPRKGSAGGFSTLCELNDPADVASILMKVNDAEGGSLSTQFEQYLQAADTPVRESTAGAGGAQTRRTSVAQVDARGLAEVEPAEHEAPPHEPPTTMNLRARLASLRGRSVHDAGEAA